MTNPQSIEDIDLRPWGYAPGFYTIHCIDCPEMTPTERLWADSADKGAWRCRKHALKAMAKFPAP